MKCEKCSFENPPNSAFCSRCGTQLGKPTADTATTQAYIKAASRFSVGNILDERYQIIEELGRGGMGRVYKAVDLEINEKVALKVLNPEISSDRKTIERFRNELKFARKIRHKNVCQMYDLNKSEETYFITMEYVSGEDLKSTINRLGRLSEGKILVIAKQICKGLAEAHHIGVIHRDLKPQNIMIDRAGDVRIMDFGIARTLQPTGLTETGMMVGTPDYMSPEQALGEKIDHLTDVYSLGVILFELATGTLPFTGETAVSVALKHKTEPPPRPRNINPGISIEFDALILKCLEKDRGKRYQSVDEILTHIISFDKGVPSTEKVVPDKPSSVTIVRRRVPKTAVWGPVALIALAVIGYLLIRPGGGGGGGAEPQDLKFSLQSDPSGASVFLNESELGTTPLNDSIPPGNYILRLEKEGFVSIEESIALDSDYEQFFSLQPAEDDVVIPETANLEINSLPAGAQVIIDGEDKGITPFAQEVAAGTYKIVLRRAGFRERSEELTVVAGETYPIEYTLEAVPAFHLQVTSEPSEARVYLDGRFQGRTPIADLELTQRTGYLRVRKDGWSYKDFQLNLQEDTLNKVHAALQRAELSVKIDSNPQGAAVFEDNDQIGVTPFEQMMGPGQYTFVIKKDGYREKRISVDLRQAYQESVVLEQLQKVKVRIQIRPVANVLIDNVMAGEATTVLPTEIDEGRHTFTFVSPEDSSVRYSLPLDLKPNEEWEIRMFMNDGRCIVINLTTGAKEERQLRIQK